MAEAATLSAVMGMGGVLNIVDGGGGDAVSGDEDGRRADYGR